jgi:hypothetical protein
MAAFDVISGAAIGFDNESRTIIISFTYKLNKEIR